MITIRQKIKPKIMPYAFCIKTRASVTPKDFLDPYKWTKENFGESNLSVWTFRENSWYKNHQFHIYFENEEDAVAFKLRWM